MSRTHPFRLLDAILALVVVGLAVSTRFWYVSVCLDNGQETGPLQVQGASPPLPWAEAVKKRDRQSPHELDTLVHNLNEEGYFGSLAPLAGKEEPTAHLAPGYPWFFALFCGWLDKPEQGMRFVQCLLGALTALAYFFFARRAFQSCLVAMLAGLFCAVHPFWIVNAAELNDGAVVTFLLALCLALGARASQEGGPFISLVLGLGLAATAMVRAALLPFSVVALLWFLWRSRTLRLGWLCGLLAFLGFANGLAPWLVRNYRLFAEPIPVVDSAYLHLYIGNNPQATGGPLSESALRESLPADKLKAMLAEPNQAARYKMLARPILDEVQAEPGKTFDRRLRAGLFFLFGESWFNLQAPPWATTGNDAVEGDPVAQWFLQYFDALAQGTLLILLLLAFLGWRWSFNWRRESRLATLALLWVPLPYLLTHAESLAGPRLPLDGVLACFAAFALACLLPGTGGFLLAGREIEEPVPWYGPRGG